MTNPATPLEVTPAEPVTSPMEILGKVLKDASQVIFLEGHVPNVMTGMKIYGLDIPRVNREDIENFVRASGNRQVAEKLDLISKKNREDYTHFGHEDIINYSITTDEYAYRASYTMNGGGTQLLIRRIPKHVPATEFRTSPYKALAEEASINDILER